ncbi:U-box domain-containing protein 30 [Hibiscus syriacus]|uniref:U-box domain-containing protein n=1 Tax=Hibiscus syriacus TaxID=106335 RepID=A0A6A3AJS3_HIBSY|nr:U-box domain-containing protein 30 [Hibiscus syriacus]
MVGFKDANIPTLKENGVIIVGFDGSGDGQVLDLDTAVESLGGVVVGGVISAAVGEKLDLKTMIEELDLPEKYSLMKKKSKDVQGRVSDLLQTSKKAKGQARIQALKELKQVMALHTTAIKTVVDGGGVSLISSLLGPFTSHVVGSEAIVILVNLELDSESKTNLMQPTKISLMVDMINEGSVETKINCTRLIEKLMEEKEFCSESISSHRLLVGLMCLVKNKRHSNGIMLGLSLLRSICLHKQVMSFTTLSSLPEGKEALKDCGNTIPNMVRLLIRVSESYTQYALSILWSICKLALEECSLVAVEAGLATKLLLVIQSSCNPVLKQKSSKLLKLCSLNYKDTIFISKCKLTRTIQ